MNDKNKKILEEAAARCRIEADLATDQICRYAIQLVYMYNELGGDLDDLDMSVFQQFALRELIASIDDWSSLFNELSEGGAG